MGGETLPDVAIVDLGAFCEANFLWYVIEIFSFGFFYSLNDQGERPVAFDRSARPPCWTSCALHEENYDDGNYCHAENC